MLCQMTIYPVLLSPKYPKNCNFKWWLLKLHYWVLSGITSSRKKAVDIRKLAWVYILVIYSMTKYSPCSQYGIRLNFLFLHEPCRESAVFCTIKSSVSQHRTPFLPSLLVFALGAPREATTAQQHVSSALPLPPVVLIQLGGLLSLP